MGDDGVADVQFVDAVDGGDGLDVVVMQAMAGIDDQPLGAAQAHACADAFQLLGLAGGIGGVGVAAGVQFDRRRADAARGADLAFLGVDEQRYLTAQRAQALHGGADAFFLAGHVQAALGGQFLAGFRHQADVFRAHPLGEGQHRLGDAHLEVHAGLQALLEQQHVALLDMPAVFAQVHGDAVGAGFLGIQRGLHRVGIAGAARLAQGGDVVDVDAELDGFRHEVAP